jgi:hypothetical protein
LFDENSKDLAGLRRLLGFPPILYSPKIALLLCATLS